MPKSVSRADAIYNIGRAALVMDALRGGDLDLLQKVMDDRIHQPYRVRHISGGTAAYKAPAGSVRRRSQGRGPPS
ncbi:MAG: hypothetical protein HND47_11095 [Chloroflexi bacterium]|nr:hypothetical protein [Chloroflexota bacterium]